MAHQAEVSEWCTNVSVYATWTDEDFIGRIARVSRRTHPLSAARNCIQRCLGLYRRQWLQVFHPTNQHGP